MGSERAGEKKEPDFSERHSEGQEKNGKTFNKGMFECVERKCEKRKFSIGTGAQMG